MRILKYTAGVFALLFVLGTAAVAETFYVYTENGKTLNLRSPTNNQVIANIPYGTALEPDAELSTETAAYVTYKGESGYVKWKYLVKEKPAKKKKSATPEPAEAYTPYEQPSQYQAQGGMTGTPSYSAIFSGFTMNRRNTTLTQAAPMRWVPDATAPIMRNYQAGQTFEVLVENAAWCQVLDSASGLCGFIQKNMLN